MGRKATKHSSPSSRYLTHRKALLPAPPSSSLGPRAISSLGFLQIKLPGFYCRNKAPGQTAGKTNEEPQQDQLPWFSLLDLYRLEGRGGTHAHAGTHVCTHTGDTHETKTSAAALEDLD